MFIDFADLVAAYESVGFCLESNGDNGVQFRSKEDPTLIMFHMPCDGEIDLGDVLQDVRTWDDGLADRLATALIDRFDRRIADLQAQIDEQAAVPGGEDDGQVSDVAPSTEYERVAFVQATPASATRYKRTYVGGGTWG